MNNHRVIVIGAGASGMMAAGRAAEKGADVLLLEKMPQPGQKLLISGKTRCNVTNTRDMDSFIEMYGTNGRFLYSAFHRFFREDLLAFLNRYDVATIVERGGRIFPATGDAHDVVRALEKYLADGGVSMVTGVTVTGLEIVQGKIIKVKTNTSEEPAGAVVLAAGGASFPGTGSSGDGYRLASAAGHTVTKLRPGLVPLVVFEVERAQSMQGVSLRNVRLTAYQCAADDIPGTAVTADYGRGTGGRKPPSPVIESRQGEMMMTHFGIGGPVTLLISLAVVDALEQGPVSVAIDLKPGLSAEQLRQRLQRDFDAYSQRSYRNILKGLLPQKMIDPFVALTGIPAEKPGHQISATERDNLLRHLKSLRFNIKGPLPLSAAIVTAGGVSLKEVDPRTMASKLVKGLFFCGEVLDIDADTGGYNLQAAFSTGYVAGESAATYQETGG